MTAERSYETLTHFRCDICKGWWTVGDAVDGQIWFCCWCGIKHESAESIEKSDPQLIKPLIGAISGPKSA